MINYTRNPDFPVGSRVVGVSGWAEYVLGGEDWQIVPPELPVEALMCVMHIPGLTAYVGLNVVARPVAGETIVISGAAGSVGSLVGQMARAEGLRVIGVAGTDEKCQWLEDELGFDKAINYRTADPGALIAAPMLADSVRQHVPKNQIFVPGNQFRSGEMCLTEVRNKCRGRRPVSF